MLKLKGLSLRVIFFSLFIPLTLAGCQYVEKFGLWPSKQSQAEITKNVIQQKLQAITTIYVQSLTGENQQEIKDVLFKEIEARGYKIVDILPDDEKNMGVLRMWVENYSLWENREKPVEVDLETDPDKKPKEILRRNALIGVNINLFDGETGTALIRERFSQPFQQIYVGKKDTERRPKEGKELLRLTKILTQKVMERFETSAEDTNFDLERGEAFGWVANEVHDYGDPRVMKGNDYASSGQYQKAKLMWKIVLFAPNNSEPEEVYLINRATAFYNLGQVYHTQGDYLFAAKMFSQANRLQQKLKYAQAWGDNMHAWLDAHLNPQRGIAPVIIEKKVIVQVVKAKPPLIQTLESNNKLLLDAKQLWPLEPKINELKEQDLNGLEKPDANLYPKSQLKLSVPDPMPLKMAPKKKVEAEKEAMPAPQVKAGNQLIQPQESGL
ncbi:MAG: hypothetical protein QNL04_01295 [SAR324 cluster bacterium]|nr:hypothetical protein [SAR324 cluster bacterium]